MPKNRIQESVENLKKHERQKQKAKQKTNKNKQQQTVEVTKAVGSGKFRGKLADPITLPRFLRFIGAPYTAIVWELLICVNSWLYFGIATYETFFTYNSEIITNYSIAMDLLFFLDLLLRLGVEVYRHRTHLMCTFFFIPFSTQFWLLELISQAPFEIVYRRVRWGESMEALANMSYFKLNRCLRLLRISMFLDQLEIERILSKLMVFVLQFFNIYLGFIHIVACVLYFMSNRSPLDYLLSRNVEAVDGTWLAPLPSKKPGFVQLPWTHYILTVTFSTSVVTTVGFGDLSPQNEYEMILCIGVMLIGAIGMAGIFGSNMTTFMVERDGARYDLLYRMSFILKTLKRMNSSALFAATVREYYYCLWNFREGVYHVQFINYLPPSMHEDILFDICTEMFDKAILFRGLEEPFLRAVSRAIEVVLYNPDMIICQQGDYAMSMYYIIQGECVVKSKHSSNVTTAILRAGCIIGESSLFFSYPYAVNIETKTCCQLLKLGKENLMIVFNDHAHILDFMRTRMQERMTELRKFYEQVGTQPITWIQFKSDVELLSERPYSDYPTELRWAHGLNSVVTEDIVDDTESPIIVDMSCLEEQNEKDNNTVYSTCVVPPTLISQHGWVQYWHIFIIILTLITCVLGPYNLAFDETTELSYYTVKFKESSQILITITFIVDVFVEITTAVPVTGIYYKLVDGWGIKKKQSSFYFDVFAAIPFDLVSYALPDHGNVLLYVKLVTTLSECFKLWKLVRYLHYLDNAYPERIFIFRLFQTTTMLIYSIHFLACGIFVMACRPSDSLADNQLEKCKPQSWLSSYYISSLVNDAEDVDYSPDMLANFYPYTIAVYFSAETLSSAGFGDFAPQTTMEMMLITAAQILGFYIIGYYTALLTSALSCTTRPTVFFQQKLVSIRQFLQLQGMSERLRSRILEHYTLQHQYLEGVVLPQGVNHPMYDAPPYLEEDGLFAEAEIHLEGIPIFTKVDPKVIIRMAKLMDRYILPPNIFFIRRGDVRRQMYVIYKGSLAILKEDSNEVKSILEPTGHYGVRDLLFGEPAHNNIKTLSYCLIYAIDLQSYNEVFENDDDLMKHVVKTRVENFDAIQRLTKVYADLSRANQTKERKPTAIPSFTYFPTKEKPDGDYDTCDYSEFKEPYEGTCGKILKLILLRRTVHPAGTFAVAWNLFCGIVTAFVIVLLVIESGNQLSSFKYHIMKYSFYVFFYMDMYLKMHWGYYTESNHLISHPVKTCEHFVFEGPLIYNLFFGLVPSDFMLLILRAVGWKLTGEGVAWLGKLRWIIVLQGPRMFFILKFGRDVFKFRTFVLLFLYVSITLALCTVVAVFAFYLACPWGEGIVWTPEDVGKLPACIEDTWVSKKEHLGTLDGYSSRWIVGVYYVCQTALVIGFGDMITLAPSDIYLLVFMMIVGFIFLRCIISDMTAAAVDSDEIRAEFIEQINCLTTVLQRERVHSRMISNAIEHMKHTWAITKGLKPQHLLWDLHPALQSDLFSEYIGNAVSRVPIFSGVRENILRTVCTYMRKMYFTRGERIMRRGNLEYEMYIIVDGDVWITEQSMEMKCVLGPGESMGETQMMYGLPRKFTAIAGNSVEVFALGAQGFSEILDRYPSLKNDIERRLVCKSHDVFERKIAFIEQKREALNPKQKAIFDEQCFKNTAILCNIVYTREIPQMEDDDEGIAEQKSRFWSFLQRRVLNWGPDDYDLPFFYCASPNVIRSFSFMIHPKCGFQSFFQNLVLAVCFLSPALGTYQVCFAIAHKHLDPVVYDTILSLTWVMEIIMIAHILIQFVTPFETCHGKYCKMYKKIAIRYVVCPHRFAFDLISTLPVHLYDPVNLHTNWRFLNLLRCIRLFRYLRTQTSKKEHISVSTFRYNMSISVPFFFFMAHILACVFYALSDCDTVNVTCPPGTWTDQYISDFFDGNPERDDVLKWKWYVRSLYWVVTTISTTGFGDITGQSLPELSVAIVAVFCGAFILSIILSQFVSGITSITKFQREFMYQVTLLASYLTNIGLSNENEGKLVTWFIMLWDICRGTSYKRTTSVLPLSIQMDVNLALYRQALMKVSLFNGMDKKFMRQVASRVNHTVYLDGFNVVTEGDVGHTLFIVYKGRIAGYVLSRKGLPKLSRWYEPGNCFGVLPALVYEQTYSKTYRAEVTTEILWLGQKDIYHLARLFPEFAEILQKYIESHYDPSLGTTSTIFSEHQDYKAGLGKLPKMDRISKVTAWTGTGGGDGGGRGGAGFRGRDKVSRATSAIRSSPSIKRQKSRFPPRGARSQGRMRDDKGKKNNKTKKSPKTKKKVAKPQTKKKSNSYLENLLKTMSRLNDEDIQSAGVGAVEEEENLPDENNDEDEKKNKAQVPVKPQGKSNKAPPGRVASSGSSMARGRGNPAQQAPLGRSRQRQK